ncbi:MAG: helix-turn-helix domain-containing protein, partial [Actinomycetota bacterium]|nr:helix-turn-helix domain-containing protein [Actinomycetota bacterium]
MNENNSYDDTPKNISTGRLLKSARQELGLSLEEASRQTGIPASILESIEREDGIPSGAFRSRVFLRSYTDYLGLDGSVLSRHPKPERPTGETPQQEAPQQEAQQQEAPREASPELIVEARGVYK